MPAWRSLAAGADAVVTGVGEGDADVEDQRHLDDVGRCLVLQGDLGALADDVGVEAADSFGIACVDQGRRLDTILTTLVTIVLPPVLASPTTVATMTTDCSWTTWTLVVVVSTTVVVSKTSVIAGSM